MKIKIPNSNLEIGGDRVFVIAELGKNFIQTEEVRPVEEYIKNAKELIHLAKESGADAVKFQTHEVEDEQLDIDVTSPHFKGSDRYSWVTRNTNSTPLYFWQEIKKYCDEIGILFFSTPMSRGAAQKIDKVGVDLWKVGSGDILDFVALDYIAKTHKPVIFSSGMSTLEETSKALNFLKRRGVPTILLHCVSKYPCPPEDLQLNTIKFYQNKFYDTLIGFSDHSVGWTTAIIAVAMGAKVVEKHFSLNRELWGADHKVSMTPQEMSEMVSAIRKLENNPSLKQQIVDAYNQNIKEPAEKNLQEGEAVFRPFFRKSLMASRDIKAGETIREDMLYAMRPQIYAGGLPSEEYENILGKAITKDIKKFDPITMEVIK